MTLDTKNKPQGPVYGQIRNPEVLALVRERQAQAVSAHNAMMTYLRNVEIRETQFGDTDVAMVPDRMSPDLSAPYCITQPSGGDFTAGTSVDIATEWIGEEVATYQWWFDDDTGTDWRILPDGGTSYDGQTTDTLTINSLAASSVGRYYCRAIGVNGKNNDSGVVRIDIA